MHVRMKTELENSELREVIDKAYERGLADGRKMRQSRKMVSYLVLVFIMAILLMSLWITLGNITLPVWMAYVGTGILYLATFAGLLRGIIWTVEHFVKWIESQQEEDEA